MPAILNHQSIGEAGTSFTTRSRTTMLIRSSGRSHLSTELLVSLRAAEADPESKLAAILVVEDDDLLRELIVCLLRDLAACRTWE